MIFRTPLSIAPASRKIAHSDTLFCIGSCFAQNIASFFAKYRFEVMANPLGVMFNPASVVQTMERIAERRFFTEADLLFRPEQGVWFTLNAYSEFNDSSKEMVLDRLNRAVAAAHDHFSKSSVVVITLGTTWVYEHNGVVVANCQKLPAAEFSRRAMATEEVIETMSRLFLSASFFGKQVIFSVSPIRHLKDGFAENSFSKSSLICAEYTLCERFEKVDYFPAYEIMMDDLRDYRFYDTDMVHPSPLAVEYIWERFSESYMDAATCDLLVDIERVNKALAHRPFHPDTVQYKKHIALTCRKKEEVNRKAGREIFE